MLALFLAYSKKVRIVNVITMNSIHAGIQREKLLVPDSDRDSSSKQVRFIPTRVLCSEN